MPFCGTFFNVLANAKELVVISYSGGSYKFKDGPSWDPITTEMIAARLRNRHLWT